MSEGDEMKNTATIHQDGSLTIAAEVLFQAGFHPGEQVELATHDGSLLLIPARNWESVFAKWGRFDRSRPPMSMAEIVAEQREIRGHDDLG